MQASKRPGFIITGAACLLAWAVLVRRGSVEPGDIALTRWAQTVLLPHATAALLLATALGNFPWVIVLTLGSGLWWARVQHYAWAWASLRVPVAVGVADVLKGLVQQARPGPAWAVPGALASGYGWPSGHAVFAIVLGGLWIRYLRSVWVRLALAGLILTVAVSRIALGVHWPSQVASGLLLGGLFAAVPVPGRNP